MSGPNEKRRLESYRRSVAARVGWLKRKFPHHIDLSKTIMWSRWGGWNSEYYSHGIRITVEQIDEWFAHNDISDADFDLQGSYLGFKDAQHAFAFKMSFL